jgi:uncharacterized membrane protein YesL
MSDATAAQREFGNGPLSRVAALVYTLLAVELLFSVTIAPGLVLLMLLDRDASNLPLAAACALPLGPAWSAALYAIRHRRGDITDLRPVATFWRAYRANFRQALLLWAAWLAWLTIIAVNLANFTAAAVPVWWAPLLVIVGVAATLWCANALVITSLFSFRARDVARLAAYFLVRAPGVTLGNTCLLIVAAGVTLISSEAVLAMLGSLFALALLRTCQPMIARIQKEFTT